MQPSTRTRHRGLRIGVVLGDTLIAEQTLDHGTFSIGRKASCSVPLPLPGLPARWDLLTVDARGAHLRLAPSMDVRLADGAVVKTRTDLEGDGTPGRALELTIPVGGRGKVTAGELKIMFHELELAPRAPAPSLPRELRSTLADRVDRRLVAFAAASLALHVGVMAAARLNDPPADLTRAEQVMADYVSETTVIDADDLAALDPTTVTPEPAVSAVNGPAKAPEPVTRPAIDRPAVDRPARPTHTLPLDAAGDAARTADALFSDDDTGGLLSGDAARRRPSGDLAQQLAEVRDAQATASIGDGSDRDLPRSDGPQLGTVKEPGTPQIGPITTTGRPKPEPDDGRIILTPPKKPPPGEPTVDTIVAKIQRVYMPGLVRCYRKSMSQVGPMSGKVVLAFAVGDRGGVSGPAATGVDDDLERCVEGLMAGWRFEPILDGDGDPTEVDVKLTLQLRPD